MEVALPPGAEVEVRFRPDSPTWTEARFLDVPDLPPPPPRAAAQGAEEAKQGEAGSPPGQPCYITVSIEVGGEALEQEVVASQVRVSPSLDDDDDDLDLDAEDERWRGLAGAPSSSSSAPPPRVGAGEGAFGVGDLVEVHTPPTSDRAASWSLSRVRCHARAGFLYVSLCGGSREEDAIVPSARVRRATRQPPLDRLIASGCLRRVSVKVFDEYVARWCSESPAEASACAHEVRRAARLLNAFWDAGASPPRVVLIGSSSSVDFARSLLIGTHFRRLAEVLRLGGKVDSLKERLAGGLSAGDAGAGAGAACHFASFEVDTALVGYVIGKGGRNVMLVQDECGVHVARPRASTSEAKTLVEVRGSTIDSVEEALRRLQVFEELLPLASDQAEWVLGRSQSNLREVSKQAGLASARYDAEEQVLRLYGTREALDTALSLLETHALYFDCFEAMEQERQKLDQSFLDLRKKIGEGRGGRAQERKRSAVR